MFKQITDLAGKEYYLIGSLLVFMIFFIMVALYLFRLSKNYVDQMSTMPIQETIPTPSNDEEV